MQEKSGLYAVKLILVFALAFSLASLPGPLSGSFYHLPSVHAASIVPNSPWYPAGPAMNTETVNIFSSTTDELSALCAGTIDLTDFSLAGMSTSCPVSLTTPISARSYYEVEFDLGNNFWGVPFQFGNNASGVQIRQGIAHLFDKLVFTNTDPDLAHKSIPIDNPLPPSNGGLPAANPCGWDTLFPETGSICTVGTPGGVAYHISPASGLCGNEASQAVCQYQWMPGFTSIDFCAAAQHFIAAGLAMGRDSNCVLTGVKTAALTSHPVNFVAKSDSPPRYRLATGLAEEICALFTGYFAVGCIAGSPGTGCLSTLGSSLPTNAILCLTPVTLYPDCVFHPPSTSINTCWGMYTGGFGGVFPFDTSLYGTYNSLFASGGSFDHPPCASTTAVTYPSNYMFLCLPSYDLLSNQIESAPCLSAPGDPAAGQTTPTFADCPGTGKLTAVSAGYQAENTFGKGADSIPIYSPSIQFGYLPNWTRVINADGVGLPNYFTWLNGYNPRPTVPGTIREGFKQPTDSLNPYTAATAQDSYVLHNIYETLYNSNPLGPSQIVDWMTSNDQVLNNTMLGYTPPTGTLASIRNTLRNSLFWHDGPQVTAWDVEFSLLTLSCQAGFLLCSMFNPIVGVSVLSRFQFDINMGLIGPFTKLDLSSFPIIPGRHWSVCGQATWDADVSSGSVPSSCMSLSPIISSSLLTFDPLAAGILIGSGPWACENTGSNAAVPVGTVGTGCSSSNTQSPPAGGTFTLTRFGCNITAGSTTCGGPGSSLYSRSNSKLALYVWTGNTGDHNADFVNISTAAFCFQKPIGTLGCTHWQEGIGNPSGDGVTCCSVGFVQISAVAFFFGTSWVSPYTTTSVSWNSLTGIAPATTGTIDSTTGGIVLYEGSTTFNPASVTGCTTPFSSGGGYDC